jgi:glutamate transport system substrate-binding protein
MLPLLLLSPAAVAACSEPDSPRTINIGLGDNTPGFSSGDPPAGLDVAFKDHVLSEMSDPPPPEFSRGVSAANRQSYLLDRKATWIVASYSITSKRNQNGIDFAGPYMQSEQGLLVSADETRFRDKGSVVGKSVCTVGSTTGTEVAIPHANLSTSKMSTQECVDLLAARQTDAVFTDTLILYGFVQANPGKFRVVLSGAFGSMQYYGIGMLGGHVEECRRLNKIIEDYLRVQWRIDFQAHLPAAVRAVPSSPETGDFESRFKPPVTMMQDLSCKVTKEPPRPEAGG